MTHGNSKVLLQPTAIYTSLHLWDDFTIPQCVGDDGDERDSRWQYKQSPSRRAKSHSPSRRLPKLKHTNGRLDGDPQREGHQQLLTRLQPTPVIPIRPVQQEKDRPEAKIPKPSGIRRSVTCTSNGKTQLECATPRTTSPTSTSTSPTRLKICYRDEALRARSAENTRRVIVNARQKISSDSSNSGSSQTSVAELAAVDGFSENAPPRISSNQQKLALKALKYRNLLARTNEIDDDRLRDPSFDVLECLGVKWCKV